MSATVGSKLLKAFEPANGETRDSDHPRKLGPPDLSARYLISERLAADWLRAMHAANTISKIGRVFVGRLSAVDEWVASGGTQSRRGRPLKSVPKAGAL